MKKILALVLTAATAVSVASVGASAAGPAVKTAGGGIVAPTAAEDYNTPKKMVKSDETVIDKVLPLGSTVTVVAPTGTVGAANNKKLYKASAKDAAATVDTFAFDGTDFKAADPATGELLVTPAPGFDDVLGDDGKSYATGHAAILSAALIDISGKDVTFDKNAWEFDAGQAVDTGDNGLLYATGETDSTKYLVFEADTTAKTAILYENSDATKAPKATLKAKEEAKEEVKFTKEGDSTKDVVIKKEMESSLKKVSGDRFIYTDKDGKEFAAYYFVKDSANYKKEGLTGGTGIYFFDGTKLEILPNAVVDGKEGPGNIAGDLQTTNSGKESDSLVGTDVYINDGKTFNHYLELDPVVNIANPAINMEEAAFGGPSKGEVATYKIEYHQGNGAHQGSPKGVNGEDLMRVRVSYERKSSRYKTSVSIVKNPTVEIFEDVNVDVTITTSVGAIMGAADKGKQSVTDNQKVALKSTTTLFGGGFDLMNARYTSDDVIKDGNKVNRISAANQYPVVDETAFEEAYGQKLIVSYPDYNVVFPTVKNQNVALNLEAKVEKMGTVGLAKNVPMVKVTFHDVYVKDAAQIEFKIGADAQNFKGQTLYAYELNAKGQPIKGKELKAKVNDNGNIVIDVAAGARLAGNSDAKSATYGVFNAPQEAVADNNKDGNKGGTTTGNKNPGTGASDVVSAATAFATMSVAAAGFVALKKSNR